MSDKPAIDQLLDDIRQAAHPVHGDRGKLAALRRGFSEATAHYAWPHIATYCDITDERSRIIWLTVAAAAATLAPHEGLMPSSRGGNMGTTLRLLALGEHNKYDEKALHSFEARFRRLLTCQTVSDLCRHIPRLILAATAKGKPVNVRQLFWDIRDWEHKERRNVRIEWAKGYWGETVPKREETATCDT